MLQLTNARLLDGSGASPRPDSPSGSTAIASWTGRPQAPGRATPT